VTREPLNLRGQKSIALQEEVRAVIVIKPRRRADHDLMKACQVLEEQGYEVTISEGDEAAILAPFGIYRGRRLRAFISQLLNRRNPK